MTIIFTKFADSLGPILTDLFNLFLEKGRIPDEWKVAYVTPIYKGKGPKSELNNYRPISVISPVAKVFETLVASNIRSYLDSRNVLSESQYGFRVGRSCELALNTMVDDWRDVLDLDNRLVAIFLDLSKAFDTVDHKLLLKKLFFYNFDFSVIELMRNYLSDRYIRVNINGQLSKNEKLSVGVPQGSVLGPLLFIVFINDLAYLPLKSKLLLFADDTTAYMSGSNISSLLSELSDDLARIKEWLSHNRLVLNLSKTHAMFFKNKNGNAQNSDCSLSLKCGDVNIEFVEETKLLGVILDCRLKFSSHINHLCKKANAKAFLIKKSLYLFPLNFRTLLFKLFIVPHFDYCSSLFIYF